MPEHVAYLLWVCIFYFFLHSPYPLYNFMREMSYGVMEFLFGGCMSGYITNFQCRSVVCGSGRVRDLDHGSMK
jgi:hypothetical protein